MKRSKKEKEIAAKLCEYAKEIGEAETELSATTIHNKIDNLKSKARDHYRKYRKATATGSAVTSTDDEAFDLEKAYTAWMNFRVWHKQFKDVPGFGPLASISSVSVGDTLSITVPQSFSSRQASPAPTNSLTTTTRPLSKFTGDDSEEDDFGLSDLDQTTSQTPISSSSPTPTSCTSSDTPSTFYKPGSLKRVASDSAEPQNEERPEQTPKKKKMKIATSNAVSAGAAMVEKFAESQRELQNSQQVFMSNLMKEQRAHTQMLAQSQQTFQAQLFQKFFSDKKE